MTGPRNATSAVALSIGQEKPFSSEKFRNAWFRKYGIGGRPPLTCTSMLRRELPRPRPGQVPLYEPVIAAGCGRAKEGGLVGKAVVVPGPAPGSGSRVFV